MQTITSGAASAALPKPQTLEERFVQLAAAYAELASAYGALVAQRAPSNPYWSIYPPLYGSGSANGTAEQLPGVLY